MHRVTFAAKVDSTFFNYSREDLIRLDENNHQIWRDMSLEILRNITNTIDVSLTFVVAARIESLEKEPTFKGAFFLQGWENKVSGVVGQRV